MVHELQGRHAIITGAGAGIGAAIALGLAKAGCRLTLSGRSQNTLQVQAEALRVRGADALEEVELVLGLDPFDAQEREAQGDHALVQRLDLHAHIVGHAWSVGLVFGVHLIAKCPALGIEDHGERAVRVLLAQTLEHVQHAFDRTGRQAFGSGQWWQRVKGAVQVRRTVHQDEGGLAHEQDQPFRRVRR